MSVSFLRQTQGAGVPSVIEQGNEKPARRTAQKAVVSVHRHSDSERTAAISLRCSQVIHYLELGDIPAALRCSERIQNLIQGGK